MATSAGLARYLRKQRQAGGMLDSRKRYQQRTSDNPDQIVSKEYGFVMTPEQEGQINKGMTMAAEERAKQELLISNSQKEMEALIESNKKDMDKLWEDFSKDFVEIKVYEADPEDYTKLVQTGTYKLPKNVVDELDENYWGDYPDQYGYDDSEDPSKGYTIKPPWVPHSDTREEGYSTSFNPRTDYITGYEEDVLEEYQNTVGPVAEETNAKLELDKKKYLDEIEAARSKIKAAEAADQALLNRQKTAFESQTAAAKNTALSLKR